MDLHPVRKDEIQLGKPLKWPVYDQNNVLLLKEGSIVQTPHQLERLSQQGLFRNLLWSPPRRANKADVVGDDTPQSQKHTDFASINFKIGDTFQVHFSENEADLFYVKYIGYLENSGIIVSTPSSDGGLVLIKEHQCLVVRAFSGKSIYTFPVLVTKSASSPFPHIHLAYPKQITVTHVRKSRRVKSKIIGTMNIANEKVACVITDLSTTGAMVESTRTASIKHSGDNVQLSMKLTVGDDDVYLTLNTLIKSVRDVGGKHTYGVEFVDLTIQDKLALQTYVYQSILGQPL